MTTPTTRTPWALSITASPRPVLEGNLIADVVVIGGGVTGMSTALRLAEQGKGVILVEARTVGGATGSTPGHVTEALDTRYAELESSYGVEGTRLVASSSRQAITQVARWCEEHAVPGFRRLPGFLFSESPTDREMLEAEHAAASRAGAEVSWDPGAPLPFAAPGAVRFDDQGQIAMGDYLMGLERGAAARNVRIYENTRVVAVDDAGPCMVHLENGATVRARSVVFATRSPPNRLLTQTKLSHHQSYGTAFSAIGVPDALYWDCASPGLRLHMAEMRGEAFLVVDADDHETVTEERSQSQLERLTAYTCARFGDTAKPELRWSSQVIEPSAGLPVIGRSATSESIFVATGFGGNGLTMGTVAALVISDLITRVTSRWAPLFDPARAKPTTPSTSGHKDGEPAVRGPVVVRSVSARRASYRYSDGSDFPVRLIGDWVAPEPLTSVAEVGRDEGRIVKVHGERLAVYRDVDGCIHATSAVCTHLGGIVKFNDLERTWDCPCHGSRFDVDGTVLEGPATLSLARRHVDDSKSEVATPSQYHGVSYAIDPLVDSVCQRVAVNRVK